MESCVLTERYEPDVELIDNAQQGDNHAMEYLLYKYRHVVKNKVRHFFVKGADKDDLLQIGMIGLWQAVTDYSAEKNISFISFAKICVERHIVTAVKSGTRKKQSFLNDAVSLNQFLDPSEIEVKICDTLAAPAESGPEEQLLQKESLNTLQCCIQSLLSEFEWEVLLLHNKGKSYAEIADYLGCKAKSVDNALTRVRRKLECSNIGCSKC